MDVAGIEPATPCLQMRTENTMWLSFLAFTYVVIVSFVPRFTITHAITAALTRIERARGFLDAAKLPEDWIGKMQKRASCLKPLQYC